MTTVPPSAPSLSPEPGADPAAADDYVLTNVRAVLADRVADDVTVEVTGGRITALVEGGARPGGAVDGANLLLLPGLVDTHSDGLEREINPRRTAHFAFDYAIQAFEGRLRSSGITTAFHGVGYQEKERSGRTVAKARELNRQLTERRVGGRAQVDHRVLFRFEARDPLALTPLLEDLDAGTLGDVPLISFEDHTPGQGQYHDASQFAAAIDPSELPEGQTVDDFVAGLVAEAEQVFHLRETNMAQLGPRAKAGEFRLLAHDADSAESLAASHEAGATIAEFPVSVGAAEAARERDMAIVMGAPNALRGSSHTGNTSARELVAAGLCDVLASDYLPPAMLQSVFAIAAEGITTLPRAVGLITSGPAAMAGLADRGRLAEGTRADLVLVDDRGPRPAVVGVRRADDEPGLRVFG